MTFHNRSEAGALLAEKLKAYANRPDAIVLAVPRGGVPVAFEVAGRLNLPLDLFIVRKLGVPSHPELAMGAIATGGIRVFNSDVIRSLGISPAEIEAVTVAEQRELERRMRLYRGDRPPAAIAGRTVILIDDGIATGSTIRAGIEALRAQSAGKIVVASPTIAASTALGLSQEADELVAVITPREFYGVGQWYEQFPQLSDDQVGQWLKSL